MKGHTFMDRRLFLPEEWAGDRDRRAEAGVPEGVIFRTNCEVGVSVSVQRLLDDYDIVVMSGGAELPRDLEATGRQMDGVHFAMEFLPQQNKRVAGDPEAKAAPKGAISAAGFQVSSKSRSAGTGPSARRTMLVLASAFSARRRRVAHSRTTRKLPPNPLSRMARHSAAALRAPAASCFPACTSRMP